MLIFARVHSEWLPLEVIGAWVLEDGFASVFGSELTDLSIPLTSDAKSEIPKKPRLLSLSAIRNYSSKRLLNLFPPRFRNIRIAASNT